MELIQYVRRIGKKVYSVFLGVEETVVGSLLYCGVSIVLCIFNLLCYVIW